jgi:hypothetical protein
MPSLSTQVHVVFDDSGSMYYETTVLSHNYSSGHRNMEQTCPFIKTMRMEFDAMADRLESSELSFEFHLFSDTVKSGSRLGKLPSLSGGTNIALGFEAMQRSVQNSPCEHSIVIFVSDGADSRGNQARRALLTPLPCKSTLLTVAVGTGFPTSLVVNELRVKYHTFGGDSVPLVFPILNENDPEMQSNIQWVVSQLEEVIKAGGVQPEFSIEELGNARDMDVIFRQCKRWYNACTIKCMSPQPQLSLTEKIELVKETKEMLSQAEDLMKNLMVGASKPLPSNLRARRPIFLLTSLREKLNTLLEQLNKGRLFDELTDEEKQKYLSFGNNAGRLFSTSMKYNAANFETSKASLMRLVRNYTPTKEDEQILDQINLCSWAEYMEDAKNNADLFSDMRTLAGVLEGLPFVGRAVELHPIPACAQINPWVDSIKKLPMTIKTFTTHDLYIQYSGSMELSNETSNSIIVFGGTPSCPGIFCHLQSFALTKNWLLYFNDARLAAASMLVVYVLGNEESGEWKSEELSHVRSICTLHTPINSRWWIDYLACMRTDAFRKCLVTESPKLDKFMTCPGLGKFILGMWWLVDQGCAFTEQNLIDRFQAVAVELLGRCKLNAEMFFSIKCTVGNPDFDPVVETLSTVIPELKASHVTKRRIKALIQSALQFRINKDLSDAREKSTVYFNSNELMKVSHFNLSLKNVKCFFTNLFETHGFDYWAGPGDDLLMRSLMIATSHDTSFDRNHPTSYVDATAETIIDNMTGRLFGKSCVDTRKDTMSKAMNGVVSYFNLRHMGLPRPIPHEHVDRYNEETGRDIAETWQLDHETCLSPIACCFPACDLYLVIPPGDKTKQKQVIRDHLRMCCRNSIPGLHRSVVRNLHLPSSDIIKRIKSGADLGESFLPREVTRRLEKGVGVYGGVPRSYSSAEQYKEHALEIERKATVNKMKAAIEDFTGGDTIVLYHAIDDIKISLDANMWSYSEFKRTFDVKYAAMQGV